MTAAGNGERKNEREANLIRKAWTTGATTVHWCTQTILAPTVTPNTHTQPKFVPTN